MQRQLTWIFQALDTAENDILSRGRAVADLRFEIVMHVLEALVFDIQCAEDTAQSAISGLLTAVQHLRPAHLAAIISQVLDMFDNWEKVNGAVCVSMLKVLPNAVASAHNAEEGHGMLPDGAPKLRPSTSAWQFSQREG
jgi:hypothetical protein